MLNGESPLLRAVITGVDGAGKSTTLTQVVDILGQQFRIVKPGPSRPVYSVVNGKKEYHYRHMIGIIDKIHHYADESRNPDWVFAANSLHVMLQGRVVEPDLVRRIKPDLVLGARDLVIDPAVYATFYSPFLAAKDSGQRVDFLQRLTGAVYRDMVFFLKVPGQEAVKRIQRRMEEESDGSLSTDRPKWQHMHETAAQLNRFQSEYHQVIAEVQKRSGGDVIEMETSNTSQLSIVDSITRTLKERLVGLA